MRHTARHLPLAWLALACALAAPVAAGAATAAKRTGARPRTAASTPAATAPKSADAARRLEDVHIEGELEVPRITFITVRQPHRYTDYTRPAAVRSSRKLADETTGPAWISAPPKHAPEVRKENRK